MRFFGHASLYFAWCCLFFFTLLFPLPAVFRSVELKPVAAVNVLLYSGWEELQVRGPIQISLPLGHNTRLRAADTVPAWAFNLKIGENIDSGEATELHYRIRQHHAYCAIFFMPCEGAWENQGLGIVKKFGKELVWTYTASHLGSWIAAPLPSSYGTYHTRLPSAFWPSDICVCKCFISIYKSDRLDFLGHESSLDFLSYHTYLLVGIFGATLAIVIGFLSLLLCHCR